MDMKKKWLSGFLAAAQDAVTTAQHNLFTAYSAYNWAVRFGVLN